MSEQQPEPVKWAELSTEQRNRLVSERVFGYTFAHEALRFLPSYTTSLDAAWLVVREMNKPLLDEITGFYCERYATFVERLEQIVGSDMFFDLFYCDAESDHLTPERLCLVALRACGVEIDMSKQ